MKHSQEKVNKQSSDELPQIDQVPSTSQEQTNPTKEHENIELRDVDMDEESVIDLMSDDGEQDEAEDDEPGANDIYDIDEQDASNPQYVTEYVHEIFECIKEKELQVRIPHNYMSTQQKELAPRHREILVNWICEVYLQLRLLSETLFLTVDIVDRLLSCRTVTKSKLHLVGLGALMIASKFEETYAPPISDLRICSENAYTESEMLRVERVILNALDFNFCIPTPLMFLRRYSKAAQSDSATHTLSKYICELSVVAYDMIQFLPSHIAVAAVFLARRMKNISPNWCPNLLYHADVTAEEIQPCAIALNRVLVAVHKEATCAIYRKYADSRFLAVARVSPAGL